MSAAALTDNEVDAEADEIMVQCLDLARPKSFFLFAGAGSGKTRSLVSALNAFRAKYGAQLRLRGQRAGVITYTNAACDEIKRRLEYDPAIVVETIHSFAWHLIEGLNNDIKEWVRQDLISSIAELDAQQAKGRATSKAYQDRIVEIASKKRKLERLDTVRVFKYDPNGDNRGHGSLSHSDVIKMASHFLSAKRIMQSILVGKFPILLVDESQDTLRPFMEALLVVQQAQQERFALGLLGDTMQRIYADGKEDLVRVIPDEWARPAKAMNHRCPPRVVKLINRVRAEVDQQEQRARSDKSEGLVRLFIVPQTVLSKAASERAVSEKMASLTNDQLWTDDRSVKALILEHHMAARRMGFLDMYEILSEESSFQTSLMQGALSAVNLFSQLVFPLVEAHKANDKFAIAAVMRQSSPLLSRASFRQAGNNQMAQLLKARDAVASLTGLWDGGQDPSFANILRNVAGSGLFEIPDSLKTISERSAELQQLAVDLGDLSDGDADTKRRIILDKFLETRFSQIGPYSEYVSHTAKFDTHQGVKGLEFPRVMVIMDDAEARGFLFKYDKLFGAEAKSARDLENEAAGKDTSIDRSRRLFYVTCSRAEESLALVAYSSEPTKVRDRVVQAGWFEPDEIELLA